MTMPDETQRRPRILISITSTQSEKLLKKCFDALRIPIFYQCRAQGTAPSEILEHTARHTMGVGNARSL